jgi:Zn finger protein HypA/HybF involved in hydrogenase expression
MSAVQPLNRTLDQELVALMRGASLECLVCGEFVLHRHGDVECPECGFGLRDGKAKEAGLQLGLQAG